ncbi:MAG: hypothetical protein RMI89_07125 [Gloeomargarita sp. SKYBB_i_bin120]|nr:hypothetical protein [Gloeomargarita sp. SKYG98]MCS7292730.1 hypothetical protein [Gloeomargarita sp. SKYB120]MDW8178293.1 hypothetical protein [Gloeomargarita sp. SKYBB_i_bin120]
MKLLRLYLILMTVVWASMLIAVVLPAFARGMLGWTEARTAAQRLLVGAVWTLPGTLGSAVIVSWLCFWRRWQRWAFYSSLLPVVNVLVAGVAWWWEAGVQSR